MTKPFGSCSINDLLLSPETLTLVSGMGMEGALQHARLTGNRMGQRIRSRTIHSRDNANFVEIELEDRDRTNSTTLLIEDNWTEIANQQAGGLAAGTHDAQFAMAEIEARLRSEPDIAKMNWLNQVQRMTPGKSSNSQTAQIPSPLPSEKTGEAERTTAKEGNFLPHPSLTTGNDQAEICDQSLMGDDQTRHSPDPDKQMHDCDTDGIPSVIFEEREP